MPRIINLAPNRSIYMRKRDILTMAFKDRDKKPVRLVSTYHSAKQTRQGNPKTIVKYKKKYMGGVDLNDMLTSFYSDNRKTVKLWKRVVFNLIQRYVINAYILYMQNTSDGPIKTRLQFTESVIDSLANEYKDVHRANQKNHLVRMHNNRQRNVVAVQDKDALIK